MARIDSQQNKGFDGGPRPLVMPQKRATGAKLAVLVIAGVVVLAGVAVALANTLFAPKAPSVAPVSEPAYVKAAVKVDGLLLPGNALARGDVLTRVQPATDLPGSLSAFYYRALFQDSTVYVEKKRVRLDSEPVFEPRFEEADGPQAPDYRTGPSGNRAGDDGDEITMPVGWSNPLKWGVQRAYADESTSASGDRGVVLADGTPSYFSVLNRGSLVDVVHDDVCKSLMQKGAKHQGELSSNEPWSSGVALTAIIDGKEIALDSNLLSLPGQDAYEQWKGYVTKGAKAYSDYRMEYALSDSLDGQITVVDAVGQVLLAQCNGAFCYVLASDVSTEKENDVSVHVENEGADNPAGHDIPTFAESQPGFGYDYSNGDDPAQSNASSSGGTPEWTEPIR